MRAKRDFIIVTCHSVTADGTYVLTSRSLPDDINGNLKVADKNGVIRGICYTSGYVLHPYSGVADGDGEGCEISYACHIHMKGGGSTNELRRGPLVNGAFNTLVQLAELPALQEQEQLHELPPLVPPHEETVNENTNAGRAAGTGSGEEGEDESIEGTADSDSNKADSDSHLELLRHCSLKTLAHLKVNRSITMHFLKCSVVVALYVCLVFSAVLLHCSMESVMF